MTAFSKVELAPQWWEAMHVNIFTKSKTVSVKINNLFKLGW